ATFQVVFFEGSSDILFNYLDVDFADSRWDFGVQATVGIQVSPTVATTFSFRTPSLSDNMSLLWRMQLPPPSNTPPSVSIASPTNGASFAQGESILFSGSASDVEDGDLSASLSWSSSVDGFLGTGANASLATLSVGSHFILAEAVDSEGAQGSASVTISVGAGNQPPVAGFDATTNGLSVDFVDTSTDDGVIVTRLWGFGYGNTSSLTNPTHSYAAGGTFVVTLTVTDDAGATGSASQSVTVSDPTPTISLVLTRAELDEDSLRVELEYSGATGATVQVLRNGTVIDTPSNDGEFRDRSDVSGSFFVYQICEANGVVCSNTVEVGDPPPSNQPPTVSITAPATGSSFTEGDVVAFAGTATDAEDGNLAANLAWTSSRDGAIGSGAGFSVASLSVGTHVVTAAVSDSQGVTGSAVVTISVVTAPSQPAVVQVNRAQYRGDKGEWRVAGSVSPNPPAGESVTVYLGATVGGPIIGAATTDAVGSWSFREKDSPVVPPSQNVLISVETAGGAILEGVVVNVR
ncbi:MAG: PKD domain-containing protein, partial [Myxococcota bacterium]